MKGQRFVYWQDGEFWLGYLEDYPDYMTQGESLEDLREHLRDLYADVSNGHIPSVRKVAELEVAGSAANSSRKSRRWDASSSDMAGSTTGIRTRARVWRSRFPGIAKSTSFSPGPS